MKTTERPSYPGELLAERVTELLSEDDRAASTALFIELCRHSASLRTWLCTEFVQSADTRRAFVRLVNEQAPIEDSSRLLAELSGESKAYQKKKALLRNAVADKVSEKDYGGLDRREIERLIGYYQAGRSDLGAFLLAHAWRRQAQQGGDSARVLRASSLYFEEVLGRGRPEQLRALSKAIRFFDSRQVGQIGRADYGYHDWWKICLLLYLLNHPKPCYRTGEFRKHLSEHRLTVGAKDIRAFCKKHGIRRDERAGRPRRPA